MKLWEGRFTGASAKGADDFNQSLSFDYKLYWHDILASIAHAKMLGETQIIPKDEADRIGDTLINMLADIEKGNLQLDGAEDIHTFVENELVRRIGAVGKSCTPPVRATTRLRRTFACTARTASSLSAGSCAPSSIPFWILRTTTCSSSCRGTRTCRRRSPSPWRST